MNTLIIGSGSPVHLRKPFVAESELFSSPGVNGEAGCVWRPAGDFDLPGYLKFLPDPWRKPDQIVVCYGVGDFLPRNMGAASCPKILLLSDLHHGPSPDVWERVAAYEAAQEIRRRGHGLDYLEDLR